MCYRLSDDKGSVLLIVLALLLSLTVIAIVSVDRASLDVDLSYNQLHSERAFYAADAGIKHAIAMLNDSIEWRTGLVGCSMGDATYSVAVVDSSVQAGLADTIIVLASATAFQAVGNVKAVLIPSYFRPFQYAAFGEDSVVMKNTACTDSYRSDSGSYASTLVYEYGNVGSNGDITAINTADIYGNASTSDGSITVDNTAAIAGDTTSSAPPRDMTGITQADYDWALSNNSAPSGFSGDYVYSPVTRTLSLNNAYDTLVLSSGVYYFSSIDIGQYASLQIAPGAKVSIYMTDDMTLGQGGSVNPGGSPSDLHIFSQGSELMIGQHTEFRAAFWGPSTDITVEQNTNVYGALNGKSVNLLNSACVHYDRSLMEFTTGVPDGVEVVAWKEM